MADDMKENCPLNACPEEPEAPRSQPNLESMTEHGSQRSVLPAVKTMALVALFVVGLVGPTLMEQHSAAVALRGSVAPTSKGGYEASQAPQETDDGAGKPWAKPWWSMVGLSTIGIVGPFFHGLGGLCHSCWYGLSDHVMSGCWYGIGGMVSGCCHSLGAMIWGCYSSVGNFLGHEHLCFGCCKCCANCWMTVGRMFANCVWAIINCFGCCWNLVGQCFEGVWHLIGMCGAAVYGIFGACLRCVCCCCW